MPLPSGPPVLVTGTGNLALGAMRVLGRRGIRTYAGAAHPGVERWSRWYRPVPGQWNGRGLEEDLSTCGLETAVVVPTSEAGAIEARRLPAALEDRFPSSGPDAELLELFADKRSQGELFAEHGVPYPRTWTVQSAEDVAALPEEVVGAVFLKPRDSGPFSAVHGRKAVWPSDRDDILPLVTEFMDGGFEMVLQEYVPGPPSNSYLVDGFIDRLGEVRGLFARRRIRQCPLDFGNSSAVESVDASEVVRESSVIVEFLQAIGYRGIFNAEFKRDERDGSFKVFEVNPRTWLYAEFASRCGFDALTMAYLDALGHPVPPLGSYEVGRRVIYPYYDLSACLQLRETGDLRALEAIGSWMGADQLLFVEDDPRPAIAATLGLWRGYLGRRLPW